MNIIQAIDNGTVFVFDDGEIEHKAKLHHPPRSAPLLDGDYELTSRVHWRSFPGIAHICDAAGLLEHMAKIAPLSAWGKEGGAE